MLENIKNEGKCPDYKISFSVFTSTSGLLTKTITPDNKGGITKVPSEHMTSGYVVTQEMPFSEFGPFLRFIRLKRTFSFYHMKSNRSLYAERLRIFSFNKKLTDLRVLMHKKKTFWLQTNKT
ncbi:MAG: hypothetical protein V2B20_05095 [Pseudomonadota bacterium]